MVEFYEAYTSDAFAEIFKRLKLDEFVQLPTAQMALPGFAGENPSVGIILCPVANKCRVAYTMSDFKSLPDELKPRERMARRGTAWGYCQGRGGF